MMMVRSGWFLSGLLLQQKGRVAVRSWVGGGVGVWISTVTISTISTIGGHNWSSGIGGVGEGSSHAIAIAVCWGDHSDTNGHGDEAQEEKSGDLKQTKNMLWASKHSFKWTTYGGFHF